MSLKLTSELAGNTPTPTSGDTPSNAIITPAVQPVGTQFMAMGEGGSATGFNRAFRSLGEGVDYLAYKLLRPIPVPTVLSGGQLSLGAADQIDLIPDAAWDGWMFHGANNDLTLLKKYIKLLHTDGTLATTAGGAEITVTDVYATAAPGASIVTLASGLPQERVIGGLKNIFAPDGEADKRDRIVLAVGHELTQLEDAAAYGLVAEISGSVATAGAGYSNNGRYRVLDQIGAGDTTYRLSEYRYRVRLTASAAAFTAGRELRDNTTGARMTMTTVGSDYIEGVVAPVDGSSVPTDFGVGTTVAEYNGGAATGVTGTSRRYTKPGDPVLLTNVMTTNGQVQFRTDGKFSRRVSLKLSAALPLAIGNYRVVLHRLAPLLEASEEILAGIIANSDIDPSAIFSQITLNTAYDAAAGSGRDVSIDAGAIRLTSSNNDTRRDGMLQLDMFNGRSNKALQVVANNLEAASADKDPAVRLEGPDGWQVSAARSQPLSMLDVAIPVQGAGNVSYANTVTYDWTGGGPDLVLTFTDVGIDLAVFFAAAAYTKWPSGFVVVEVRGATHTAANGLYVSSANTATTLTLKRISDAAAIPEPAVGAVGSAQAVFWARSVILRGYSRDGGSRTNHLIAGVWEGDGGAATPILIKNNSATILKARVSAAGAESDDADYIEFGYPVHVDKIRSTDARALGADGTRLIDLTTNDSIYFKIAEDGGAGTLASVLSLFRTDSTNHSVRLGGPTGGALQAGEHVRLQFANDLQFHAQLDAAKPTLALESISSGAYLFEAKKNGGSQLNSDSDGDEAILLVPDIAYGSQGNTAGKLCYYDIPLTSGLPNHAAWFIAASESYEGGTVSSLRWVHDHVVGTNNGVLFQIPPEASGSAAERTSGVSRYLRGVDLKCQLELGSNTFRVDLLYQDSGASPKSFRIGRTWLTGTTAVTTVSVCPKHKNIAPVQGAIGDDQIKLNVADTAASGYDACSTVDGTYVSWYIKILSGTGSGQVRVIDDFVAATAIAHITAAWTTSPDATSVYEITPNNPANAAPLNVPEIAKTEGRKFFLHVFAGVNTGDSYFYGPEAIVRNVSIASAA